MTLHGTSDGTRPVLGALYVLIESGLMYSLCWVVFVLIGGFGIGGRSYSAFWMCQISVRVQRIAYPKR